MSQTFYHLMTEQEMETLVHSNRAQITVSSNLTLPIPVVLYGQQYREIQVRIVHMLAVILRNYFPSQVHVGGYISFGDVTITPSSCPFNLSSSPLPVISPVCSLADNCLATAVLHYRVLTQQTDTQTPPVQQTDTHTVQTNKETLAQVVARIATFNPELASFEPSLAVVVTWKLSINDSSEVSSITTCVHIVVL